MRKSLHSVGLLGKKVNVLLLNNKPLALSKLHNLEKKLGKDQNIM